jgi:hypothetical protein
MLVKVLAKYLNRNSARQHSRRCSASRYTHSLGFFFGPGLPRSLGGALGSIIGAALLRPDAVPPPLFRLPSTFGGGARELGSGVSAPVAGTGVELESSDLDGGEGSGCAIVGAGSTFLALGVDDAFRDEAPVILSRSSEGMWRVTILVFREPFGVDLAGVAMASAVTMFFSPLVWRVRCGCRFDEKEVAAHSRGWLGCWDSQAWVNGVSEWNVGGCSGGWYIGLAVVVRLVLRVVCRCWWLW